VDNRLSLVPPLAARWHLRAAQLGAGRTPSDRDRPGCAKPGPQDSGSRSARPPGVGGEACGYDGGKKARGKKRHLLVDTEGLVPKAKVHSAKVPDQDGSKLLANSARTAMSGLKHLWLGEGYEGRGTRWVEEKHTG